MTLIPYFLAQEVMGTEYVYVQDQIWSSWVYTKVDDGWCGQHALVVEWRSDIDIADKALTGGVLVGGTMVKGALASSVLDGSSLADDLLGSSLLIGAYRADNNMVGGG